MGYSEYTSPYSPNTEADRQQMLEAIGVTSLDELFQDIPAEHRNPSLDIPPPGTHRAPSWHPASNAVQNPRNGPNENGKKIRSAGPTWAAR